VPGCGGDREQKSGDGGREVPSIFRAPNEKKMKGQSLRTVFKGEEVKEGQDGGWKAS
jgi:hypothetical protein